MKKICSVLAILALALTGCDQYLARSYGGTATTRIPAGAQLVTVTWKGAELWVLYYDPKTKECVFAEDSALNVLEGTVKIPDCNPVQLRP